ncbi:hypothetical protein DMENIID0001_116830 [Sergentomyia squamirostris]
MHVSMYVNGVELQYHQFDGILPKTCFLSTYMQLEKALRFCLNASVDEITDSPQELLEKAYNSLFLIIQNEDLAKEEVKMETVCFLADQLKQLISSKRRYEAATILKSFTLNSISPSGYRFLRQILNLPHPNYLRVLKQDLQISAQNEEQNHNYIKEIVKILDERGRGRVVSLMIDEIYVEPQLDYKGRKLIGQAENTNALARTIQTFMIGSVFGNYQAVVKLMPVLQMTGDQLYEQTKKLIDLLQDHGLKVLVVITDNHKINQSMISRFCGNDLSMPNPMFQDERIFFMYDTVHIFKNIRNNWINSPSSTFEYPDFKDRSTMKLACYEHVVLKYEAEKGLLIKQAFKLNRKTVYPNVYEKQCVEYVDNVFHDSTIASLLDEKDGYQETSEFLQIIRDWWNCVNVKSVGKDLAKRTPLSQAITRNEPHLVISHLEDFLQWLTAWEWQGDGLTRDTFKAISRSTQTLIELVKYSFDTLPNVEFILLGKFQSDEIEGRFGSYRRLSGCHYKISATQVFENENQLRLRDIVHNGVVHFNHKKKAKIDNKAVIERYRNVFFTNYLEREPLDKDALLYVSGYAARQARKPTKCEPCLNIVFENVGEEAEGNDYFNHLQRGGLIQSTVEVTTLVVHMSCILAEICDDGELMKQFYAEGNNNMLKMTY